MAEPKKLLVFLSHSIRDKAVVRRLNRDLKSRSVETWLDEQDIRLGASITGAVQSGIENADVALVFLSQASVASNWVNVEWQSKFFAQVTDNKIHVVPVLLEDCMIPLFMRDRRYLDFRKKEDYEANLSLLLAFLEEVSLERLPERSIEEYSRSGSILEITRDILDDLDRERISIPVHKSMPILGTLKTLPRSGKKVRLEHFKPVVKIRSVYDHLLSLAHLADCILPEISHNVPDSELADIALCIAYHELNEVVLGDIPTYTSLSTHRRNTARIYAEERLRTVAPPDRKRISNDFIWMFLSDKHRRAFESTNRILADTKSHIYITFKALDKIDPIVSTWRYLHHYRGQLGQGPKAFNTAMKDFFENPDVKLFLRANKMDTRLIEFVVTLQDRRNAWDYYEDPLRVFNSERMFGIPSQAARRAIEGIPLFTDGAKR